MTNTGNFDSDTVEFLMPFVKQFVSFQISWYRNGNVKLSTSDEIVIKANEPKYILKIEKLRSKNFGNYTCRASNELGTMESVIEITGK